MDTLTAIFTRRSTRHFDDRPIEDDKLRTILEAAMSGPSCVNSKDWAFIVVTERETLDKMAEANGRPAQPLKEAVAGILVCGDMERAFERAKDYWIIDGAIAAENMQHRSPNAAKSKFLQDRAKPHRMGVLSGGTESL